MDDTENERSEKISELKMREEEPLKISDMRN